MKQALSLTKLPTLQPKCHSVDSTADVVTFWRHGWHVSCMDSNNHSKKNVFFRYRRNTFFPSVLGRNGRNPQMVQNHQPNLDLPFLNLTNINIFIHMHLLKFHKSDHKDMPLIILMFVNYRHYKEILISLSEVNPSH